jgi:hypothetical protein
MCRRIFTARYESQKYTISSLETKLGSDQNAHKEFHDYWLEVKNTWLEAGCIPEHINWHNVDHKVKLSNISRVTVCDPEDTYRPFEDYVQEFGDPSVNNLGHKRVEFQGMDCVVIPGKRQWKVKRERINDVRSDIVKDDGSFQVGSGQLEANFGALSSTLFSSLPSATGVSLDRLLGGTVQARAESSSSAAKAGIPDKKAAESKNADEDDARFSAPGFAFGNAFGGVAAASSQVTPKKTFKDKNIDPCAVSPPSGGRVGKRTTIVDVRVKPDSQGQGEKQGKTDGKRGRPKRPILALAKELLQDFEKSGDSDKYFGLAANFRRSMERTMRDFQLAVDSKELEATEETTIISKQLQAAMEVSRLWGRKHGQWDAEMYKQCKATKHFLLLHPTASLPFPTWLRQMLLSEDAEAILHVSSSACMAGIADVMPRTYIVNQNVLMPLVLIGSLELPTRP